MYFILNNETASKERKKVTEFGYKKLYDKAKYIFPYMSLLSVFSKNLKDDNFRLYELENLFNEALNYYAQESSKHLADCMATEETVLGGLKHFLHSITTCNKKSMPSGMCMIIKSIAELTQNDHPDLLSNATHILNRIEISFSKIFQQAIDNDEIDIAKDPTELARYFQIQIIGLRTYAQVTNSTRAIEKFIDDVFRNLLV